LPTYEYACKACGHRREAVQKFTDDDLTVCPDCGGAVRKVFGAPGIVLKGSGFYKTDTRAQDKRSSSDKASTNGADSSKSDKSDTSTKADSGSKSDSSGSGSSKSDASPSSPSSDKSAKESKPAASTAS
jgi:putative FmdB family regulatory protein